MINEKTGTVVLGGNVKVAQAVVAHGALTVRVLDPQQASTEDPAFDMGLPGAYSGESQSQRLAKIEGASVDELIRALNAIGASPRDLIAILQALRASGALQAEIEVI